LLFLKEPKGTAEPQAKKKGRGTGWIGVEYKTAVKKPYFVGAAICIFFTGMVLQGVTGVNAAHMKDVGLSQEFIGVISSVSLVALAAFKFLNGVMYDRLGLRTTITIDCAAAIGVMACLYFITNSTFGMVLGVSYALLASVALPLETVMLPIYANDLFGEKSFNKVLGLFVSFNQVGYALGGPIINLCSDLLGSYNLAFVVCAVIMFAVIITLQFVITSAHKTRLEIENSIVENTVE
jgi:MFS family permease